jgi:hypothetical protein
MSNWGWRNPNVLDEMREQAVEEHRRDVARGEQAARHGAGRHARMPWWQRILASVVLLAMVAWIAFVFVSLW